MPLTRCFVGWNAPITRKVLGFLLPEKISGPIDLGKELVVVPTRQAGRRLRETLALYCEEQNTALFSPRVVTPSYFLHIGEESASAANRTEVSAVWADVLMGVDLCQLNGLFPVHALGQDFSWALRTGEVIQQLRDTLADGKYRIADVYREIGIGLQEPDLWRDLAELESKYLERLKELDRQDPCDLMIRRAEVPELPKGVERVIVAAVPDPTPLMISALECLAQRVDVVILVYAPGTLADRFDEWGRPIYEKWREVRIDIPHPEADVILAGSPASQSTKVLELIAEEVGVFGPADIVVGVPDTSVTSFLEADLRERGLATFDPAGNTANRHPVYYLLETFRNLMSEGSYTAFSAFVQHPDVLECLQHNYNLSPRWVLEELDQFQNCHLPVTLEDIFYWFPHTPGGSQAGGFENLGQVAAFVREHIAIFEREDLESAVRSLLQDVYAVRMVDPNRPCDEEFIAVAELLDATLRELVSEAVAAIGIDNKDALNLILRGFGAGHYYPERGEAVIDLEGWLELPWNDAPFLMVTGMNDGIVPDSRLSDVFLPDSLRSQLNLRHDADRLARDVYLMSGLVESRRNGGRVCFIAGKTNTTGDPLKPSRLLFCCDDDELPNRAERLFGDPGEKQDNYPPTISFMLEATPPADVSSARLNLTRMPVTWFREYLTCPFRFYLRRILGMEDMHDEKMEMDALDFGALVHHALWRMAENDKMRRCEGSDELSRFLHIEAESWIVERFGPKFPLQIGIQLDAAKQRLDTAAQVQVGLARDGWEIIRWEMKAERKFNGMMVTGRVDRIDRHRETGSIRCIDYKTSDRAINPAEDHIFSASPEARDYARVLIGGKERQWSNLQLPLYAFLLRDKSEFGDDVELGYFNLPKTAGDTGVKIWTDLNSKLLESAMACSEGVLEDVRDRKFWPPAAKVSYDDFESLFHADVADCVNVESLQAFLGNA